jgi:hypothetical protein
MKRPQGNLIYALRMCAYFRTYHSGGIHNIRRKMDLSETNRLMMNIFDGRIISAARESENEEAKANAQMC